MVQIHTIYPRDHQVFPNSKTIFFLVYNFLIFIFGITYEYAINSNATIQSERSTDGMMEVHAIYEHFNLAYVLM